MTQKLEQLQTVQEKLEKDQATVIRAEANYETAMKVLEEEGFDSIESANTHATETDEDIQTQLAELNIEINAFMEKYSDLFE